MAKRKRLPQRALVVKLKLGRAVNMPTRSVAPMLADIAHHCNLARNRMMRAWVRWREDHPDYTPGQRTGRDGKPAFKESGQPKIESDVMSQEFQKKLYHIGRDVARHINSSIVSMCWGEVCDDLAAKVSYRHAGSARFEWQAILGCEHSQPSYRQPMIPLHYRGVTLGYLGKCSQPVGKSEIEHWAQDHCVVRITTHSKESGREQKAIVCLVHVADFSRGQRKILQRVASGEVKMSCSKLVEDRNSWFLHLTLMLPKPCESTGQRTARLVPMGRESRFPFALHLPDVEQPLRVGHADGLIGEHRRIEIRRRTLGYRYSRGLGPGKGAQRLRIKQRPGARAFVDLQKRYQQQMVAFLCRVCARENIDILDYCEPALSTRSNSFYALNAVPFNWTDFAGRLSYKMACIGVRYKKSVDRSLRPEDKEVTTHERVAVH